MIKVAMYDNFLDAYSKLPKQMQKKAREQIEKFRTNPRAGGMHYEKLVHAKDPNYHSFRLNNDYRAIVYEPKGQDVYILVHVANHEGAYNWANSHQIDINENNGSIQIINMESAKEQVQQITESKKPDHQGLFKSVKDKHILKLGVPEVLLPAIRAIDAEWELDQLQGYLPQESTDALFMLASGYTIEETLLEFESSSTAEDVNPDDFEKALENTTSQLRFCLVEDENAMAEILNAPLEKWRVFLHPSQNKLVQMNSKGPVRVLGGAGTGKTVVAMHRAKWLAENHLQEDQKVLFTTFTVNLAADIQNNLNKICSTQTLKKIEVKSIDAWVSDYLKSKSYDSNVAFGKPIDDLWDKAYNTHSPNYSLNFLKDEWDLVVQNHGIQTEKDYLRIKRPGRGKRLNRNNRKEIWSVFEEFMILKSKANLKELQDAIRDARVLVSNDEFSKYGAIVVDEAQDMKPEAYRLFRAMIPKSEDETGRPNDLFIVGDGHQKIYKNHIKLSDYDISIRGRNRSFKLKINYRTTEEIRKWALAFVENREMSDLDGEADNNKGYRSLFNGIEPKLIQCNSMDDEIKSVLDHVKELESDETFSLKNLCLVVKTQKDVEAYKAAIESEGLSCYQIKRKQVEDRSHKGLRIATMYRVKGLEFDHVVICNFSAEPENYLLKQVDEEERQEVEDLHRSLIYVAATRAKKSLMVVGRC